MASITTIHQERAEGRVARLLSDVKAYRHWRHQPLDRDLRRMLQTINEQALMSLIAHGLLRLEREGDRPLSAAA